MGEDVPTPGEALDDASKAIQEMADLLCDEGPGDLGVEREADMTEEDMLSSLGLDFRKPFPWLHQATSTQVKSQWATGLDASQVSAFQRDMDTKAEAGNLPSKWQLLYLHWHQLAGVHAIARQLLIGGPKSGVLLADEVGVGKTGTALALIALMMHYKELSTSCGGELCSGMACTSR